MICRHAFLSFIMNNSYCHINIFYHGIPTLYIHINISSSPLPVNGLVFEIGKKTKNNPIMSLWLFSGEKRSLFIKKKSAMTEGEQC